MKKMIWVSLGLLVYIACFTGYVHASFKDNASNIQSFQEVIVKQGDTLWQIADRHNDQFRVSLIKMLDLLIEYNQLTTTTIQPGQVIKIPIR